MFFKTNKKKNFLFSGFFKERLSANGNSLSEPAKGHDPRGRPAPMDRSLVIGTAGDNPHSWLY